MISKSLSYSEKFHALLQISYEGFAAAKKQPAGFPEFCQTLYATMIPHPDDFGRMSGSPFNIKQTVLPSQPRELDHYELALCLMHNVRLITLYGNNKEFLQFENFDNNQSGIIGKRTTSKFPQNTEPFSQIPISSQNFSELSVISSLTKLNLTKLNLTLYCPAQPDAEPDKIPYNEIINDLNQKAGTQFKTTSEKTKSLIATRVNNGFTVDDFKTVHTKKCNEWLGTDQAKYLRPETLYGTKFESYLNQIETKPKTEADRLAEKHAGILAWAKKAEAANAQ